MEILKLVRFNEYCPTCKYFLKKEADDPCDDCLAVPAREYSHTPIHYNGPLNVNKSQ